MRRGAGSHLTTDETLCAEGAQASDLEEQVEALCRLAAQETRLADVNAARAHYREALDLDPTHLGALSSLRALASAIGDHAETARLLDREQRHTTSPRRRARLLTELAILRRDRLEDPRGAAHAFEEALAADPENDDAALGVVQAYVDRCDWAAAKPLLDRLSATAATRSAAEQEQLFACLEAFHAASPRLPDDSHERRALASAATDRTERAIAELLEVVARDPLEPSHHRALYGLMSRTGQLDRAFSVASVLVFLDVADAEQRACWSELRPKGVPVFRSRLTRGAFARLLTHAELEPGLSAVFSAIARGARVAKARTTNAAVTLARASREEPSTTSHLAAKAFFGAVDVLGVDPPELWVRPDVVGGITAAPLEAVASVMGSTLLTGFSPPELMFVFGKHVASRIGGHEARAHHASPSELLALLDAAIAVVRPGRANRDTERAADALRRELSADETSALADAVACLPNDRSSDALLRWRRASELTALRAGLLLCGDPSIAAKVVRQERRGPGDLPVETKLRELVRFAVSSEWHELRRGLGIDVQARVIADRPEERRVSVTDDDDDDEPTRDRKLCA